MKSGLVRELTIWNQLTSSSSWNRYITPSSCIEKEKKEQYEIEDLNAASNEKLLSYSRLESQELEKESTGERSSIFSLQQKRYISLALFVISLVNLLIHNYVLVRPAFSSSHEIFEVKQPIFDFGSAIYEQHLLSYSFGNSWGSPAVEEYLAPPPEIDFNRVILQLDTTVDGVQYDRLAHLYLDGVALWRTSTAEPGGTTVHSTVSKDVSVYSNLFKKNGTKLMYQLDNLLTDRLTGRFNVTLTAFYYKYNKKQEQAESASIEGGDVEQSDLKQFFSIHRGADKILPLVSGPDEKPPLLYLPSRQGKFTLPKFNFNTTRVKLSIFTSGNANEEFWYGNVLDQFTDVFSSVGRKLPGHGPCRIVNVLLNDTKIATAAPQPFVFTGGLSPALWNPIVATGAFDLGSIDIELTPLLPLLWEDEQSLEIEISNCVDEITKNSHSSIDENWILAVNVLVWENQDINSSSGQLLDEDNHSDGTIIGFAPPYTSLLSQIVTAKFNTSLSSELNYKFTNGSDISVIATSNTMVSSANVQQYTHFGDEQEIVSSSTFLNKFAISKISKKHSHLITSVEKVVSYPMTISLAESPASDGSILFNVSFASAVDTKIYMDDEKTFISNVKQNGTSVYHITQQGNYGHGATEVQFKSKMNHPLPNEIYKRHVFAENRTVIKDHEYRSRGPFEFDVSVNLDEQVEKDPLDQRIEEMSEQIRDELFVDKFNGKSIPTNEVLFNKDKETEFVSSWSAIPNDIRNHGGLLRRLSIAPGR